MKWSQELRAWKKVLVSFIEGGVANLGEVIRADDHVDLTEDISEEVIYLVKRDIVRHQHGEFATSRDAQAIE